MNLSDIKNQIGQGELEEALEALVALLDSDPKYADLAQATRLNQADFFQTKASSLKGVISNDDARLAFNQVTDKVLDIVARLETGKLSLSDAPNEAEPAPSVRWRYYLMGGIVALLGAAATWYFLRPKEACPDFGKSAAFKTMILRLAQTGERKTAAEPEVDIMAELNKLFEKTGRGAVAKVNKIWAGDYPSPEDALNIARDCETQMIVYGRANEGYLDIEYRVLDEGGVRLRGDTTFRHLLPNQGSYSQTAGHVARFLFTVICNRIGQPIDMAVLDKLAPPFGEMASLGSPIENQALALGVDTTYHLELAHSLREKDPARALTEYRNVLDVAPRNGTALKSIGLLEYKQGNYAIAARTLDVAIPKPQAADAEWLKVRADANLRSGQPAKAEQDLKILRQVAPKDSVFARERGQIVQDSMVNLKKSREKLEKSAKKKSPDVRVQTRLAVMNEGLGNHEKAVSAAKKVQQKDPANLEVVSILVDEHLQNGDTAAVRKVIREARKAGATAKSVQRQLPIVAPLVHQ